MGSIALLARQLGHTVTGTDQNVYPPMSTQLAAAGIGLSEGYTANNIPVTADLVIVGNAGLPRGNEAVEHVLESRIPYTSGAEWLGRDLLPGRWVIAVAGTHGKTTTTSMIAWILEYAGLSPGFLIGGVPGNFPVSARLGEAPFFVIEADEYDTSYFDRRSKFLHYHPQTLVLNNLEFDHADIFPDLAAIQYQFHLLLRTIPRNGLIIHPRDDVNLAAVFDRGCWTPRLDFSTTDDRSALHVTEASPDGSEFSVAVGKTGASVRWQLTGNHNVANGLAAIAAARHAGVHPEIACEALSQFKGVKRRMEKIYNDGSLTVYDDFAHHPTAIQSTLGGLRRHVGDETILAVIEPASHTMRNGTHEHTLASAVQDADRVIWYQPAKVPWSMQSALGTVDARVVTDIDAVLAAILKEIENGVRHIVIMSNGAFGGLHKKLLERLPAVPA